MKVILFGGTGMVGQGVLRECLLAPDVDQVLSIVRAPTGDSRPTLRELVHTDFFDFEPLAAAMSGYDACFFCLGVSAVGMTEQGYARVTHDITLAAATVLARVNPRMKFIYVSGAGTDSTASGRSMWARVKGRTENALLALPLDAYMFRPAIIQPLHGIRSKTRIYQWFYTVAGPLIPLLARLPRYFTTTEQVGRAMLAVARRGYEKRILESVDINRL